MIEVIYKEEKQESKGNQGVFSIPRNIRQIGLINESYRIYVEDYVYTFLRKTAGKDREEGEQKGSLAVLLGETKWSEGVTYVFVRGALAVEDAEAAADHIDFSGEVWTKIHEEEEKYFPGQEIVGWFFAQPQLSLEATELFKRVHLKHFGGGEKVLMLMEPVEREDAFFRYENGFLVRQSGYYLYYEKNPLMQAYMIEKSGLEKDEATEKVEDEAVKTFRKIIKAKKQEEETQEPAGRTSVFSYAATACLAIAVLAVGVNFYQNYREIRNVNEQAEAVSAEIAGDEKVKLTTAYPTITPKVQAADEEKKQKEASAQTKETEQFYQEESDLRKAKRRAALAEQREKGENSTSGKETGSQEKKKAENAGKGESGADAGNSGQTAKEQETLGTGVGTSYVIRPGDTLFQISIEQYGTMDIIPEICRLNGLEEDEIIYPGQIIVLP